MVPTHKEGISITIQNLVNELPDVLLYIVPGFMAVCVFRLLTDKKINASFLWVESAALSYLALSLINCIADVMSIWFSTWELCLLETLLCVIEVVIAARIYRSVWFKHLLKTKFNVSFIDGVLPNAVDWVNGSCAVLTLKNGDIYTGSVVTVSNPTDEDQMICISNPLKGDSAGNLLWPSTEDDSLGQRMVFHWDDIQSARFI